MPTLLVLLFLLLFLWPDRRRFDILSVFWLEPLEEVLPRELTDASSNWVMVLWVFPVTLYSSSADF